jgi:hypothetical protein
MTWFHDGVATGAETRYEGKLDSIVDLHNCVGKQATAALYALISAPP